jgi:hypothetical protein
LLLIASNKRDLATDYLVLRLHERSIPFLRLNTEDYLSLWDFQYSISNNETNLTVSKSETLLSVENITGAYIRQPRMPDLKVIESDKEFAEREVGESLKSLWRSIDDDLWLNAPHKILRASNKPEQLSVARSIGFVLPDTYIGSNYGEIYNFFKKCSGKIIAKAVKHGFFYDGNKARVAATQVINENTLESFSLYAQLPMIYQRLIEKQYDIRVIVVGSNVFATAIESQSYEETKVDWRLSDCYKIKLNQYAIQLPDDVENYCLKITKKFNLRYAAIDLIFGLDNNYYFLELNPNGQWAWIDQMEIHKIRDAIINELMIGKLNLK